MGARLASGVWVSAYLTRLRQEAIAVYVVARGDATAGAVVVKVARLDGHAALWRRLFDPMAETRSWTCFAEGLEPDLDAQLSRERARDPDLWILEIEDRDGRHLLDQPGMEG